MKDTAPSRIKKHIQTLVNDVDLYTNHFLDPSIPKTNNHVEEYYRQIDPEKMKKQYKTIPGLTRALQLKAIFWIIKHGLIPEDESLRIARQHLSKQYNKTNIYKVFSDKKKDFLTHSSYNPSEEIEI